MIRKAGRRGLVAAIACAAVTTFATGVLLADTYPRQPGIKITNYTFDSRSTDASERVRRQARAWTCSSSPPA